MSGIVVCSAALVIMLSIFNGLELFHAEMFSDFDPDVRVTPKSGKVFLSDDSRVVEALKIDGIEAHSMVLEENGLLQIRDKKKIAIIKGVDSTYVDVTNIDKNFKNVGGFRLWYKKNALAIIGMSTYRELQADVTMVNPMRVFMPRRKKKISNTIIMSSLFKQGTAFPISVYQITYDVEDKYVILPISFVRDLLEYKGNEVSAIELRLTDGIDKNKIQKQISTTLGSDYVVKNRYQQKAMLYKTIKTEKLFAYCLLTLILLIASFNMIASLIMVILDKKRDIFTLRSLGADMNTIRKIFYTDAVLMGVIGAFIGIVIGVVFCLLQQKYGFISLDGDRPYPFKLEYPDLLIVFITVCGVSLLISRYPISYVTKKYLN